MKLIFDHEGQDPDDVYIRMVDVVESLAVRFTLSTSFDGVKRTASASGKVFGFVFDAELAVDDTTVTVTGPDLPAFAEKIVVPFLEHEISEALKG